MSVEIEVTETIDDQLTKAWHAGENLVFVSDPESLGASHIVAQWFRGVRKLAMEKPENCYWRDMRTCDDFAKATINTLSLPLKA